MILLKPLIKNCIPRVATIEGMPIKVTNEPLINPTIAPDKRPTRKPKITLLVASNVTAKIYPERAMTEGKERSISPIARTNVKPRAIKPIMGTVDKKA
jgi:hypothetical protein